MASSSNFGRRGADQYARQNFSSDDRPLPSYRELAGDSFRREREPGVFSTMFRGARGALIALGGCSALLGAFVILGLRGSRSLSPELTSFFVGAAIFVLFLPRIVALLGKKS